nr:MAG TPA: hypothetical protein [Caudoviricetes sp.]
MIFNQTGGGGSPELQAKTASPSTSQQIIVPDAGFDGMSQVTVTPALLETKSVTPSTSQQIITPSSGYYGMGQVTVSGARLQSKTVTPSASAQTVTADSGYLGLSIVNVSAMQPNIDIIPIERFYFFRDSGNKTGIGVTLSKSFDPFVYNGGMFITGGFQVSNNQSDEEFVFFGALLRTGAPVGSIDGGNKLVWNYQTIGAYQSNMNQKMIAICLPNPLSNSINDIRLYAAEASTSSNFMDISSEIDAILGIFEPSHITKVNNSIATAWYGSDYVSMTAPQCSLVVTRES